MKRLFLIGFVFLGCLASGNAQSVNNQTVTLTLQNAITLSISSATCTSFLFNDTDDYTNGITNTNASIFEVKSNRSWAVTVKSAAASFTGPAAPAATMPASVLGVRLNGGSSFISLSTSTASLKTGSRGISSFNVDYNASPGFIYDAGTYSLSVVYTATQQ
jgi:hypothetical protein